MSTNDLVMKVEKLKELEGLWRKSRRRRKVSGMRLSRRC